MGKKTKKKSPNESKNESKKKRVVKFIGRPTRFKSKKAYDRKKNKREIRENEDC